MIPAPCLLTNSPDVRSDPEALHNGAPKKKSSHSAHNPLLNKKELSDNRKFMRRIWKRRHRDMARVQTLFDPESNHRLYVDGEVPYLEMLHMLEEKHPANSSVGSEAGIFLATSTHEPGIVKSHGSSSHFLVGDLQYRNARGKVVDLAQTKGYPIKHMPRGAKWHKYDFGHLALPAWVESDAIDFVRCGAKGILAVVDWAMAKDLLAREFWKRHNLLLLSTSGMPVFSIRRLLHRLEKAFSLPTYVLSSNSTWGYFLVSVLYRGMVPPHLQFEPTALKKVRYLGIRAFDYKLLGCDFKQVGVRWDPHWTRRIKALANSPVFAAPAWQEEFRQFRKQSGSVIESAVRHVAGAVAFDEFLARRLGEKTWLAAK